MRRPLPGLALNTCTAVVLALAGCGGDPTDPAEAQDQVRLELSPRALAFAAIGEEATLVVEAVDGSGQPVALASIQFVSRDSVVASVQSGGRLTARGNGETWIVGSLGDASDSVVVTVSQVATALLLSPDSITLTAIEDSAETSITVLDTGGSPILGADASMWIADTSVAAIRSGTTVVAKQGGSTLLIAESDPVADTSLVVVAQVPVTLELSSEVDTIRTLGAGPLLSVSAQDANGFGIWAVHPTWLSSDTTVVTVDQHGQITGQSDGNASVFAFVGSLVDSVALVVDQGGGVRVTVQETGGGTDPDGYMVSIGSDTVVVTSGGEAVLEALPEGEREVALSGAARHCSLTQDLGPVDVRKGATTTIAISMRCAGPFAYEAYAGGNEYELRYLDENGTTGLISDPDIERSRFAWSPDGAWIAYSRIEEGNTDLFVARPDGSEERRLTTHMDADITPAWSPNGEVIVFRRVGAEPGIWAASITDGRVWRLTELSPSRGPVSSPIREDFAFAGSRDVWLIQLDGQPAENITETGEVFRRLAWSPDGERLAVVASTGTAWELRVMSRDGSGASLVASSTQADMDPSWAPDGQTLVFTKNDGVRRGIFTVAANGTGSERSLTPDLHPASLAVYSTDGSHILFWYGGVWSIDLDGGRPHRILGSGAWVPRPQPRR